MLYSPIWRGVNSIEKNPYYKLQISFKNTGYVHFVHASNYFFIKIFKSNMGSISLVRTLVNYSTQSAGFRAIQWDGQNDNGHKVMPGIYRCVMTININEYTYFECYGDIQIHETFRL